MLVPKAKKGDLGQFLPGVPAVANDRADTRCLAPLSGGGRCKRKRTVGNFCRQHHLENSSHDNKQLSWEGIEASWKTALQQWEDMQLRLATTLSLEGDAENAKRNKDSLEQVAGRCWSFDRHGSATCGHAGRRGLPVLGSSVQRSCLWL